MEHNKKTDLKKNIVYSEVSQKEIWHLERWSWWTYLQGSNRDADTENRLMDTMGEGEGGAN